MQWGFHGPQPSSTSGGVWLPLEQDGDSAAIQLHYRTCGFAPFLCHPDVTIQSAVSILISCKMITGCAGGCCCQVKRAKKFLDILFEEAPEPVIVVVTHSGFTRSILLAMAREPYRPQNAELVPVLVDKTSECSAGEGGYFLQLRFQVSPRHTGAVVDLPHPAKVCRDRHWHLQQQQFGQALLA